jgi:hypothetical protein
MIVCGIPNFEVAKTDRPFWLVFHAFSGLLSHVIAPNLFYLILNSIIIALYQEKSLHGTLHALYQTFFLKSLFLK